MKKERKIRVRAYFIMINYQLKNQLTYSKTPKPSNNYYLYDIVVYRCIVVSMRT